MSFPRYPRYKPSGVEWLGEVPEHWVVDRLKWSASQCRNGIWGEEPSGDSSDIPCVRVADFDRLRLRVVLAVPTIRCIPEKDRAGRVLECGDLLLEKSGGGELQPVGFVVRYEDDRPAVCSNFVARIVPAAGMDSSYWRYLHAAAYSLRLTTRSINQTSGIQNLDQQRYFDEPAVFPTPSEQHAIASFLDRETAKIDALVAEQERLIELLKEKRQAVISHAVTKGLDPSVPMKDSGVPWLGATPAHWEVKQLKYLVRMKSGDAITSDSIADEGLYPVYGGNGIRGCTNRHTHEGLFVLIGRQGALCGNVNYADGKFWASEHAVVAAPHTEVAIRWLGEMLRAMDLNQYSLSAAQPGLSVEAVARLRTAVPPAKEQNAIASFLDREAERIDGLSAEAHLAISLLQERRSAIISAAVTGQIDVRNAAPVEVA